MITINSTVFLKHDHFQESPFKVVNINVDEDDVIYYHLSANGEAPAMFKASEIRHPFKPQFGGHQILEINS